MIAAYWPIFIAVGLALLSLMRRKRFEVVAGWICVVLGVIGATIDSIKG